MATDIKKTRAFDAFRNLWHHVGTEDYENIINILMLVVGLRPGILFRTENSDKLILFIEEKLVHFPTGLRLCAKKTNTGAVLASTVLNFSNPSSIFLDDFDGNIDVVDSTELGMFLGYSCPMTITELKDTITQPYRFKVCMGVMLRTETGAMSWHEPWAEVISLWRRREGLSALSMRIKDIIPHLQMFTNMLNAITRSCRYVAYTGIYINVLIPHKFSQQWMHFKINPGSDSDCVGVVNKVSINTPQITITKDGFCLG